MSSNGLRLVAVAVALIVAVLTGAATGLLSGAPNCPGGPVPGATTPAAQTTTAPAGTGIGDAVNTPKQAPEDKATHSTGGTNTQSVAQKCTKQEPFGFVPALTAFVGALFVGAALLLLLLLSTRRPGPAPAPAAAARGGGQADADRRTLVQAAIYVRDRVTSKALGDRLGAALHDAGVSTVEPTGARFDPAHHEAGGAAPSNDPNLIGSIAAVEVPGYVDRDGRVLRAPIVTVYQAARNAGGATGAQPTVAQHTTSQPPRREQQR